jgi:hypothetical protein
LKRGTVVVAVAFVTLQTIGCKSKSETASVNDSVTRDSLKRHPAIPDYDIIARVNDVAATREMAKRAVERLIARDPYKYKQQTDPAVKERMLGADAWDDLIQWTLIQADMEKRGILLRDSELRADLADHPPEFLSMRFIDASGKLDSAGLRKAILDPANDSIFQHDVFPALRERLSTERWSAAIEREAGGKMVSMPGGGSMPADIAWLDRAQKAAKIVDYRHSKAEGTWKEILAQGLEKLRWY